MAKRKTIAELEQRLADETISHHTVITKLQDQIDKEMDKYTVACHHAETLTEKMTLLDDKLIEHKQQLGQASTMLEHAAHTIERIDHAGLKLTAQVVELYGRDGLGRVLGSFPPKDIYEGECANQETVDMCRGFRMACEDVRKK